MAGHLKTGPSMQGSLRVNRFNPYEGYVGSESVGQDILLAGRAAMNRALDGDIVAVELLPEEQWASASVQLRKHDEAEANVDEVHSLFLPVFVCPHIRNASLFVPCKGSDPICPCNAGAQMTQRKSHCRHAHGWRVTSLWGLRAKAQF